MTVTAAFCPVSLQTIFDRSGCPIPAAQLYFYDAGTTNLRPTYLDAALGNTAQSPVLTDAFGRVPAIFIGPGAYKLNVLDQNGVMLVGADNLPGAVTTADPSITPADTIPTGYVMFAHTNTAADGWLALNGLTIGNATSGATARPNPDTQTLFVLLWNQDASLTVSGGRGLSATADYAAGKTLALPDYQRRIPTGVNGMGVAPVSGSAIPTAIGTTFGAETVSLTIDELPVFTPTVTVDAGGAVTPTGITDTAPTHVHSGTTDPGGAHTHIVESTPVTAQVGGTARGIAGGGLTDQGTDSAGIHSHTLTTAGAGAHNHNLSINPIAAHTHTATAAAIGSGNAHPNLPPGITGFWNIKL